MSTIVITRELGEKLLAAQGEVELRDESGILIGIFSKQKLQYSDAEIGWPSEEEIQRRLREGRNYTTHEVLQHLRKLEDGINGR